MNVNVMVAHKTRNMKLLSENISVYYKNNMCAIKDNFKTIYACCVSVDKDQSRFSRTQFSLLSISMTKKKHLFSF